MLFQKSGITFVSIADTHIGSTIGLHPEEVYLDKGGILYPSDEQKWLLGNWKAFWSYAKKKSRQKLWLLINGDIYENEHHGSFETWSKNPNDWNRAAQELYGSVINVADRVFITRGTLVHTGGAGNLEESFGEDIKAEQNEETGRYSSYEWLINVSGVIINAAHKGPMGRLPWTKGNALNNLAIQLQLAAVEAGEPIPHFAIRAHNHKYGTSDDSVRPFVFGQPAWQLKPEYVYNLGTVGLANIGGLILQCENGKCEWEKVLYKPEGRIPWKEQ